MSLKDTINKDVGSIFSGDFTTAAIHRNGAIEETINVFFDSPYYKALEDDLVESAEYEILIKKSDAANVNRNSTFEIDGVIYKVIEMETNIHGIIKIYLSEE